jgi:outer membrane murein-binding lipoprotein Lpp
MAARNDTAAVAAAVTGSVQVEGCVAEASDRALKIELQRIQSALAKVESLAGYTFERIDMPGGRFAGLIAQDVQRVLPEAVQAFQNNTLGITYGGVSALVVEAIKELAARVARLESGQVNVPS